MRGARHTAATAAALTVLWLASTASADGDRDAPVARLVYETEAAGEICPDEQTLRDLVVARMGRAPFVDGDSDDGGHPKVVVRVELAEQALAGTVELLDPEGETLGVRVLSAGRGDCGELVTAMTVAVTIALDPATSPLASRGAEADEAQPEIPSQSTRVEREAPVDPERPPAFGGRSGDDPEPEERPAPPPEPRRLRLGASLDVQGGLGVLPEPSIGGALGFVAASRQLSGAIEAAAATTPGAVDLEPATVRTTRASVRLIPCYVMRPMSICARGAVGVLEVRPQGGEGKPIRAFVADVGVRLGVGWEVSATLALRARVDLVVPLVQPTISVDGEPAWTASPVAGTAGLGVLLTP